MFDFLLLIIVFVYGIWLGNVKCEYDRYVQNQDFWLNYSRYQIPEQFDQFMPEGLPDWYQNDSDLFKDVEVFELNESIENGS